MDRWDIHSVPGRGTVVTLGKLLPEGDAAASRRAAAGKLVAKLGALPQRHLASRRCSRRTRSCSRTLADLQEKQDRLLEMARELEDTNRGVVALYAELDEKADAPAPRRRDEEPVPLQHEPRVPHAAQLDARALRGCCSGTIDGPLTTEQETQVRFIAKAAEDLSELVNDLLDLAKIEAGKIEVRPARRSRWPSCSARCAECCARCS